MNNKQLLQKYVDMGVQLPEYQVKSLPDGLKNTYIRKRLIAIEQTYDDLEDYEFKLLTPEQRLQYAMKMAKNGYGIPYHQLKSLTPDQRFQYAMKFAENGYGISDYHFELLTQEQRGQYAMKFKERGNYISNDKFDLLTQEQQNQYVMKRAEKFIKL